VTLAGTRASLVSLLERETVSALEVLVLRRMVRLSPRARVLGEGDGERREEEAADRRP
jgi:hypothetical protein